MRIAIINITGGGISGGYRKYLQNVIPRMASNPNVEALLCACPKSLNAQDWFEPLSNVKFINCRPFCFLHHRRDRELRWHLEKFSPDVLFVPMERYLRFKKIPVVNMVQNMEPLALCFDDNPFIQKMKNLARHIVAKHAATKSQRTIAVSGFVREFLVKRWNIPNEKISLVYHGINAPKNEDAQRPHVVPENWHGTFIFTAGSIRPARGLEDVLYALKHLADSSQNIPGLVIAGEADPRMIGYQKKLYDWIQINNLSERICWAGGLNEEGMTWCYQNCQIFVMTSRVESFGLIAGEAMAHGSICISADNPCLPEIFRDSAIFYQSKNQKALENAIKAVLSWDFQQRQKMSERAIKRAAEFSWDVCAEKTIAELAKVAKR